jgi:hypothetical protein
LTEWTFAQRDKSEQLCQLHYFAMTKRQADGDVEFLITVKEFVTPTDPSMKFFALSDKQTNQKSVPFTPCGWGPSMLGALSECMKAIHRFAYEPIDKA